MILISPVETKSFASHFGITLSTTHPVKKCLASWKLRTTCTYVAVLLLQSHKPASYIANIWCETWVLPWATWKTFLFLPSPSGIGSSNFLWSFLCWTQMETCWLFLSLGLLLQPSKTQSICMRPVYAMIYLWKNTNKPIAFLGHLSFHLRFSSVVVHHELTIEHFELLLKNYIANFFQRYDAYLG